MATQTPPAAYRSTKASTDFFPAARTCPEKSLNETLATRDTVRPRAACVMKEEVVMSSIVQSTLHLYAGWRSLLTPSGGAALSPTAIALMGATGLYDGQQPKDDTAASDANILNTALGGEFGALAAYQLAADSGLLQKPVLDLAMQFQGPHKAHAAPRQDRENAPRRTGRAEKDRRLQVPGRDVEDPDGLLRFAAGLEQGAARGYLGMIPVLGDRDLAKAVASILGDEAMHWAILRQALGENPVPEPFIS
jgi:hypothetical protein